MVNLNQKSTVELDPLQSKRFSDDSNLGNSSIILDFDRWSLKKSTNKFSQPKNMYLNSLKFEAHMGEIDNYYKKMKSLKD